MTTERDPFVFQHLFEHLEMQRFGIGEHAVKVEKDGLQHTFRSPAISVAHYSIGSFPCRGDGNSDNRQRQNDSISKNNEIEGIFYLETACGIPCRSRSFTRTSIRSIPKRATEDTFPGQWFLRPRQKRTVVP